MATALKKPKAAAPEPESRTDPKPRRGGDGPPWAIFRFLASLKLAVISLLSLATVLAVATICEAQLLGINVTQALIYRSLPFAVLLGFLGANILCAALIRYPWTKRQTGFVITHAGLLVVLAGSLVTARLGEEGMFAIVEDPKADVPVAMTKQGVDLIRVDEIQMDEKHGTKVLDSHEYPFHHGVFGWPEGSYQVVSDTDSPFKVAVKEFYPGAVGHYDHVEDVEAGVPTVKLGVNVTPPGAIRPMDLFESDVYNRAAWFQAGGRFRRQAKEAGGVRLAFQAVAQEDEKAFLDDFLNPPKGLKQGAVRFRYRDKDGKARTFDWPIDPKGVTLPGSDLTVTEVAERAVSPQMFETSAAEDSPGSSVPVVLMKVKKGDGPEVEHWGLTAPKIATFVPPREQGGAFPDPLVQLSYYPVPTLSGMVRGLVEVVATRDGKLFGRVTNRDGIRPLGELTIGQSTVAFGGNPNQAMTLAFKVEAYLPAAREQFSYVPVARQPGKEEVGVPAAKVELTVDGDKKEIWLTNGGMEPSYRYVPLGRGTYRLAFDSERKRLGFTLRLNDFQVVKEPGTRNPAEYVSQVVLTDEGRGIKDRPVTISMNRPLEHRGYKLYQSSFRAMEDDDGNETGQYMSIFQIGYDPGRWLKYGGCILVVFGTFVQFYMRAGIFTDGGKLEAARAEKKKAKRSS
ncbi:MAG TPA: cytochrome c biogenesis protein ResB [Isosphaeraceae bacterium]|jgi:hypothetical protein|nr:cytochrome c biogenesis protein ResB [Isosphaeraceae bacterium]